MSAGEISAAESRVMRNSGKDRIYGTLYLTQEIVEQAKHDAYSLRVLPEESEFPWHADIVGWPSGEDGVMKAVRKQLTQQLLRFAPPVDLKIDGK